MYSAIFGKKKKGKGKEIVTDTPYPREIHIPANYTKDISSYEEVSSKSFTAHLSENCIQRAPRSIEFRGGWGEMKQMYTILSSNDVVKGYIHKSGWQRLFKINIKYNDKPLAEGLLERWWARTHTFHFPRFQIGFTPIDFSFLIGIPFGQGPPPPCFGLEHIQSCFGRKNTY